MRQFEHAIQKIASEVQGIDRNGTARAINHLEESIDALHGKLAAIDHKINDWAKKNLIKIRLDDEELDPQDAAHEVVDNDGLFEWIPDSLGVGHEFAPQFGDTDVARLREARRVLGTDIGYINTFLPQLIEFPDLKELLQVHQDLSQLELLKRGVANGDVPAIVDSSQETLSVVRGLLTVWRHKLAAAAGMKAPSFVPVRIGAESGPRTACEPGRFAPAEGRPLGMAPPSGRHPGVIEIELSGARIRLSRG